MGFLATIKAAGEETAGRVAVTITSAPQDAGSPLHVHHREDGWFYVLDGELTIWVGGQVIRGSHRSLLCGQSAARVDPTVPNMESGIWIRESYISIQQSP